MAVATHGETLRYDEKHLTDFDVFWLRNDVPENQMVIHFGFDMEKNVDMATIDQYIDRWTQSYPRFRSKAVHRGGLRYDWEQQPEFNPTKYGCVEQVSLPNATQAALVTFIDRVANEPLGKDNNMLWKVYRVDNVPWGGCMLFWRVHHCVCDGMALVTLVRSVFEDDFSAEANQAAIVGAAKGQRRRPPRKGVNFLRLGKMVCPVLIGVGVGYGLFGLSLLASVAVGVSLMVAVMWGRPLLQSFGMVTGLRPPNSKSPLKNALTGRKSVGILTDLVTVSSAKALADAVSTKERRYTLNDILVGMAGGAFRRYFKDLGMNPDKMRLGCVMPMNIRTPKEEVRAENRFTLIFARLPVHLEKAMDRVKYMHDRMEDLKNGFEPLVGVLFLKTLNYLPQSLMDMMVRFYCRQASVVITNVNARDAPISFAGSRVTNMYGWVPSAGGIGVGVSFVSLYGKVNIGLIADRSQVANMPKLADYFVQEWKALTTELPAVATEMKKKK